VDTFQLSGAQGQSRRGTKAIPGAGFIAGGPESWGGKRGFFRMRQRSLGWRLGFDREPARTPAARTFVGN